MSDISIVSSGIFVTSLWTVLTVLANKELYGSAYLFSCVLEQLSKIEESSFSTKSDSKLD